MSKKGGSKKELYQVITNLQEELAILRDHKSTLLNAVTLSVQNPTHNRNCWALQKTPGTCTCSIRDLMNAKTRVEGK